MNKVQKIKRLQDFENMVARFQGRKPKTLTTTIKKDILEEQKSMGRKPYAFYDKENFTKIYVIEFTDNPMDAIKDVIHEGWHGYVDDFISRKGTLKTFFKIDKERLVIESQGLLKIYKEAVDTGKLALFDAFSMEERLNYKETTLYITKFLLDAAENKMDVLALLDVLHVAYYYPAENERRGKAFEKQHKITYDELAFNALNNQNDTELIDVSNSGNIIDGIDPELLSFFDKAFPIYQEYYSLINNPLIMGNAKEKMIDDKLNQFDLMVLEYTMNMLRQKKK